MALYVLPAAGVAPIVRFIEAARGPLVVNNYFFDSRPILSAIAAKVRSGEKVWIILEPRPYRMSRSLVAKEYAEARSTGAYVLDAPSRFATGYTFDHAKYAVAANEVLIGTANWDWSAFHHNREYIFTSTNPALVRAMGQVATADIERRTAGRAGSTPGLVLSPSHGLALQKLRSLMSGNGPVMIETEEIQPGNPLMASIESHGRNADVLLPGRLNSREREAVATLERAGVRVRTIEHPYMHAKMIVSHGQVFVGSQNFSATSLDHNREVGVITRNPSVVYQATEQFERDWAAAGGTSSRAPARPPERATSTGGVAPMANAIGRYAAHSFAWHAIHHVLSYHHY